MQGVYPQRHGRTIEQLQHQVDAHIKPQCPPGQPQQRMAAAFVLLRPEGGQKILRIERQMTAGSGKQIFPPKSCDLQIRDVQARKNRKQHKDRCRNQQPEHGVRRLG